MRLFAWVIGIILGGASAGVGGSAYAAPKAANELMPLVSHFRGLARQERGRPPKVVVIGEEHGRQELRDLYPRILEAASQSSLGLNCVFFEADSSMQPAFDEYAQSREANAGGAILKAVRLMFRKWGLQGHNDYFNWNDSVVATVRNLNLSPELLGKAKKLGVKIVAVDEQSRTDYITTVFQDMVGPGRDDRGARLAMEKAGFSAELPSQPFVYFRDEIVFRRSRKMAERILQSLQSGECHGGFFITGALHAQRRVSGGERIYRNGGETSTDILREAGVPVHLISTLVTPSEVRFAKVPKKQKFAYYLLTPDNFEHEWPSHWEMNATILVRQYP